MCGLPSQLVRDTNFSAAWKFFLSLLTRDAPPTKVLSRKMSQIMRATFNFDEYCRIKHNIHIPFLPIYIIFTQPITSTGRL